jgi:hypothetical protein
MEGRWLNHHSWRQHARCDYVKKIPHQEIELSKREVEGTTEYQYSLSIPGCVRKHHRKHPIINRTDYSGAILSNTPTFLAYVKYMLCYHAWCHNLHLLPRELQQDYDMIDFGSKMIVWYFNSILYRGNKTCDTDTCKIHTQLHNSQSHCYFGDLMQYSTVCCSKLLPTDSKCKMTKNKRSQLYKHAFLRGNCLTFTIREKRSLQTV